MENQRHSRAYRTIHNKNPSLNNHEILKVIGKASKRSRQILLFTVFASVFVLMATINSLKPQYNWYLSKLNNYRMMSKFFYFADDSKKGVHSLNEFIKKNEKFNKSKVSAKNLSQLLYRDFTLIPSISLFEPDSTKFLKIDNPDDRMAEYKSIAIAVSYINKNKIFYRREVDNLLADYELGKIEHLGFIKVPILGITFETNYLGLYAGITLTIFYVLIFLSLLSEYANITIGLKYNVNDKTTHHYFFYESLAMEQVLFRPRQLFKAHYKKNRRFINKLFKFIERSVAYSFSTFIIYIPITIYLLLFYYDYKSYHEVDFINDNFRTICFICEIILAIGMLVAFASTLWRIRKFDSLWNNIALEYNIEFISGKLGEVTTVLTKFEESELNVTDLELFKWFWYKSQKKATSKFKFWNEILIKRMYKKFIEQVLSRQFINEKNEYYLSSTDPEIKRKIELYYKDFKKWATASAKQKLIRDTMKSLYEMLNEARLRYE